MRLKPELYEDFKNRINIEKCKKDYIKFGADYCKDCYSVSEGNIRKFSKEFDLTKIRKELGQQKKKDTWAKKEKIKNDNLFDHISYDDLYNYYEIENHSWEECLKYFNITNNEWIKLLRHYNIHKSKKSHSDQIKKSKLEKYGDENYNNREKAKQTNLNRYGVENQFQRVDLIKESYIKKLGVDHPMKLKSIYERSISNHDYESLISKSRETYFKRTGYDNPFKNPNVVKNFDQKNSGPNLKFKRMLVEYFDEKYIEDNREFKLNNYNYDFKVDNYLIEINPTISHNVTWSPFHNKYDYKYHLNKTKNAIDSGYRVINVWDWDDQQKIIDTFLKQKEKVQARKCEVKELTIKDAKEFITKYHIQKYAKAKINIGLYYNEELISIMTFDKPRYNKNYEYELIRYCSSRSVVGGAEKLFKYFIDNYKPNNILTYCDNSKFTGDTYVKLGFKIKTYGAPSKHWYEPKTQIHITDNLLRQRGFDQLFNTNFGKGTSNKELMLQHGFVEIFDAGQSVYEWFKEDN